MSAKRTRHIQVASERTYGKWNIVKGHKGALSLPIADRIEAKIERIPFSGCWIWLGHLGYTGYGSIWWKGRNRPAHRVSWEVKNNCTIPPKMEACHWCDVRACVNPDHIWIGTHQQNALHASANGLLGRGKVRQFTDPIALLNAAIQKATT